MIFLGQASNYRGCRIWRHLFAHGSASDSRRLRQALARRYGATTLADVQLYHTGRSALAAAIRSLVPAGSPVIVPGLTCIAVIRAIKAAGCTPVYVDIDPATLQYDLGALARTLKQLSASRPSTPDASPSPSAAADASSRSAPVKPPMLDKSDEVCYTGIIMAQNTLGRSLAMGKIQPLADAAHFAIVEDLAHCAGRFYPDGREIGTVGAAAVLSFGKGKSIDTIEGGAAILRRSAFPVAQPHVTSKSSTASATKSSTPKPAAPLQPLAQPTTQPRRSDQLRDRWYPVFGWLARGLYHLGLGRFFLGALHRLHWLARSADAVLDPDQALPDWQAQLALAQLSTLPATPLREHYFVQNRPAVLQSLARSGYQLTEIWYDTPVSPARYAVEAAFPTKACPQTAWVAAHIVNLPTWYPEAKLAPARALIQQHLATPLRTAAKSYSATKSHSAAKSPSATKPHSTTKPHPNPNKEQPI